MTRIQKNTFLVFSSRVMFYLACILIVVRVTQAQTATTHIGRVADGINIAGAIDSIVQDKSDQLWICYASKQDVGQPVALNYRGRCSQLKGIGVSGHMNFIVKHDYEDGRYVLLIRKSVDGAISTLHTFDVGEPTVKGVDWKVLFPPLAAAISAGLTVISGGFLGHWLTLHRINKEGERNDLQIVRKIFLETISSLRNHRSVQSPDGLAGLTTRGLIKYSSQIEYLKNEIVTANRSGPLDASAAERAARLEQMLENL